MQRDDGHLLIRPWRPDDASALHAAVRASLPTLAQWLPWAGDDYDPAAAADWIAHCERMRDTGDEHHFGIFDDHDGRILGGVGLNHRIRAHRSAHMGYWVADDARGRGVAARAARLAARFGFDTLGLQRIVILVQPRNHASLRVAAKLGARREGVARNGIVMHGEAREALVHALIPADLDPRAVAPAPAMAG